MFRSEALQKILGRDPRPAAEQPVKVRFAQAARGRQIAQRGLVGVVRIQIPDDGGDAVEIVHAINLLIFKTKPTRFLPSSAKDFSRECRHDAGTFRFIRRK
jgi:hypothetical protein